MTELDILAGSSAVVLAAVHLLAAKLRFLSVIPRSRWLSASSGVSIAYVFVHILPDLARGQQQIRNSIIDAFGFGERHVYLIALVGMAVFYGLERLAKESRKATSGRVGEDITSPAVFWLHIGSFSVYNGLIGYLLLHREVPGNLSLILFSLAMLTHFLVNDYGLREDHKYRYDAIGRWILAAAVALGAAIGALTEIHKAAIAVLFAFLAGGVILNVMKEELPEERQSNFWAFAVGAAGYAALLIAL